ncbi:helix-turn-helix domain-containing protein [Photobacterium sanctipauli]|uniref:helix-turn-helix domain-containing protein n=1 Tax=Photobacterium sanctipauli TaxID=1342794 RepID=UPI000ACA1B1A|nr:LysR family transcriptional regulator [Photobacterium sanctipauli]
MKWNINDMPIFVAVVDCGGFTAAAKKTFHAQIDSESQHQSPRNGFEYPSA